MKLFCNCVKFTKKPKGFTLVEILVMIAIMSLLAGTIIPTLSHYLPGIELNGSARVLTGNLREAQEHAVTEQKQYAIQFLCEGGQVGELLPVVGIAKAQIHQFDVNTCVINSYKMIRIESGIESTIREVNLPGGETILLDAGISNNKIIFSSDGGPSSSGNIRITTGSISKIINVSPAGFIKIQ